VVTIGNGGFCGAGGWTRLQEEIKKAGRMSRKQSRAGATVFNLLGIHIVAYLIFVVEYK
jgi:hypothetical protein